MKYQKESQEALDAETPDSEQLEKLIEFSATLDVDLPEIPRLKQVLLIGLQKNVGIDLLFVF